MFIWPIHRFWTFSPLGWVLAILWNISEILGFALPCAPWAFGVIMGVKGQQVQCEKDKIP